MDAHTLELLEFDKLRLLLCQYTSTSLGKQLGSQLTPYSDLQQIQLEIQRVSEMVEAISTGQAPPLGGIYDVRLEIRRAEIGSQLDADQLLQIAETLVATGNIYRYRMTLKGEFSQLIQFLVPVQDLGPIGKMIHAHIDKQGHVVNSASPLLKEIREKLADLDHKVQIEIRRLLSNPEIRKALRNSNATMNGDHFVLSVAVNYRHKVPGTVHRTSATGETLFIEPVSVTKLSMERSVLKGDEEREIRRILRKLSAEVGKHAKALSYTLELLAHLDLITAKAHLALDYRMFPPTIVPENKLWLRQARHPLLEQIFRTNTPPSNSLPPLSSFSAVTESSSNSTSESPKEIRSVIEPTKSAENRSPILESVGSRSTSAYTLPEKMITSSAPNSGPNSAPKISAKEQSISGPPTNFSLNNSSNPDQLIQQPSANPISNSITDTSNNTNRKVVPIDIHLGIDFRLLIISGPNTGGKTVSLKTVGLLCVMAQCGMHIPAAEGSILPVFDNIFVDIGDEQSLEQSLSTFSSHITRIATILKKATAKSLILLDELGAGTDPIEGAALGRALLDHLGELNCLAMLTTHLGDLKTYAVKNSFAKNAAFRFDVKTLLPTYQLGIGESGVSIAIKVAKRLNLPPQLIKNANRYLRKGRRKNGDLGILQKLQKESELARNDAVEARLKAIQEKTEYEKLKKQIEHEARAAAQLQEWRKTISADSMVYVQKFDKMGKVIRLDSRKGTAHVSVGIGQWEIPITELLPEKLK